MKSLEAYKDGKLPGASRRDLVRKWCHAHILVRSWLWYILTSTPACLDASPEMDHSSSPSILEPEWSGHCDDCWEWRFPERVGSSEVTAQKLTKPFGAPICQNGEKAGQSPAETRRWMRGRLICLCGLASELLILQAISSDRVLLLFYFRNEDQPVLYSPSRCELLM